MMNDATMGFIVLVVFMSVFVINEVIAFHRDVREIRKELDEIRKPMVCPLGVGFHHCPRCLIRDCKMRQ